MLTELGRRLTVHHPIHPGLALLLCAIPGVVIGAGLWFGAPDSPALGAFCFVLSTVLLVSVFGESLFVRQEIYEHGLVLTSALPFWPGYVIPFATIDAESIQALGYQRPAGSANPTDAFSARYRQAPMVGVVSFAGLPPRSARRLARRRLAWQQVVSPSTSIVPEFDPHPFGQERWVVSFRDNGEVAARIRAQVRNHRDRLG